MPIDDVWLAGVPATGVPGQRPPQRDRQSVDDHSATSRNGAPTAHLDHIGEQGSNGAHMTPQNRSNGSSNGSPDGAKSSVKNGELGHPPVTHPPVAPTPVVHPPAMHPPVAQPPVFEPPTFDPGPDLPPLPVLRPLPAIRPLNRWTNDEAPATGTPAASAASAAGAASAVSAEPEAPATDPSPPAAPATTAAPAAPEALPLPAAPPIPAAPAAPATPAAPTVRHRRRAPETEAETEPETTPADPQPGTRRVLVLGGSGTVGAAVVRALVGRGARVAVHHASRAAEADALVHDLPGTGHLSVGADLADADAITDLIRAVDEEFGGLDVVINAASAARPARPVSVVGSSLGEWTDAWTGALTVDVLGAATVAHAAAAAFVARGRGGRIILLAAKGRPHAGQGYVATAAEQAVGALGSALAAELAPHGIGVVVVGSGSGSAAGWSPDALADTVAWLASGPIPALPGAVVTVAG